MRNERLWALVNRSSLNHKTIHVNEKGKKNEDGSPMFEQYDFDSIFNRFSGLEKVEKHFIDNDELCIMLK